jgi:hypothetical protein
MIPLARLDGRTEKRSEAEGVPYAVDEFLARAHFTGVSFARTGRQAVKH